LIFVKKDDKTEENSTLTVVTNNVDIENSRGNSLRKMFK